MRRNGLFFLFPGGAFACCVSGDRMEYVKLGRTGLEVSRICLGCMSYGGPTRRQHVVARRGREPAVHQTRARGRHQLLRYRERLLARQQRRDPRPRAAGFRAPRRSRRRDQGERPHAPGPERRGLSRRAIMGEIDASLRRLGMDHVDLYQIHRWDYNTPIEETLEALHDVVKAGKARYIGASSMYAWQFGKALAVSERHGWTRFVSMQNYVNLLYREEEREMLPLCAAEGIGVIPGARSRAAGSTRDWDETRHAPEPIGLARRCSAQDRRGRPKVVERVAKSRRSEAYHARKSALAWLLSKSVITAPIVGATKVQHLEDALAAVGVKLTAEEIAALEEPYIPHNVVGTLS